MLAYRRVPNGFARGLDGPDWECKSRIPSFERGVFAVIPVLPGCHLADQKETRLVQG